MPEFNDTTDAAAGLAKRRQISISGRVQGVWFRGWTQQEAVSRGLDGCVRNRFDGSVEALFAGPPALVDEMVALCHGGPRFADVQNVEASPDEPPW